MSLELVTVRARTRGKGPQEFSYQGVGKLTERKVIDKDGQPIIFDKDGKAVEYSYDKDNKLVTTCEGLTQDKDGNLVLAEGYRYVVVDDIDANGLIDAASETGLQEVIDLFGTIKSDTSPLQRVIDGALNWFNVLSRKEASPVSEVVTEDELTPIIAKLIEGKILKADDVAVWRRNVTSGSKLVEMDRKDYVKLTKEYKAGVKAGISFETAA